MSPSFLFEIQNLVSANHNSLDFCETGEQNFFRNRLFKIDTSTSEGRTHAP